MDQNGTHDSVYLVSEQTTCGSLLQQLQMIWDEVGESDEARDKMLFQLEQECLDVYKRKVDQASKSRALLLKQLADSRAELAGLLAVLGEKTYPGLPDKSSGTIKEQLASIAPTLELLCKQKEDRLKEFTDVQLQIQKIGMEVAGSLANDEKIGMPVVQENNLSLKKLDEFHVQLQELQKEKSERLHKVLDFVSTIHDLCAVLGMNFLGTITEVHPSLNESVGVHFKSISNETLYKLSKMVEALREEKKERLHKLQELAAHLIDLWNLMDASIEERNPFGHVTCNMSATVDEVIVPGALALDIIQQVELEEIFARAHILVDSAAEEEKIMALIESGNVEAADLFSKMDDKILKAREEALSRRETLEKVEKWMSTCEEENWLEDYSRDQNRYNSSRGAHLNLKRAEKARILVSKIPALVDTLLAKTRSWEETHGMPFTYDGVSLLSMLSEYTNLRHGREEERRRMRDQKRIHEQLATEQEALFGSKPSPSRSLSTKKVVGPRPNGGHANQTHGRRLSHYDNNNGVRLASKDDKRDGRLSAPANYVAIAKEDAASVVSEYEVAAAST
ncbi:hypothetical protein HPP92_000386 [Vanilla planifolia]|uniref:Uncharacterized protein n=1 Tax=Vanilla planifolia TaxID=51239 RepID=A0A835RY04_VANPL|nr:hypothetical protein HPP92_000386 [Vanilla planifolia]